ncbi:hypothetical protein EJB05_06821 [Eragrostis curvula]|uniref:Uncharacterized protein n=1 Tax=Eragrostis curvula TaxID=38414 RepID=A0A5J9WFZ9_9POAL|nr:hypothetical protein EJB05_06821 [Eragrostis curvula]
MLTKLGGRNPALFWVKDEKEYIAYVHLSWPILLFRDFLVFCSAGSRASRMNTCDCEPWQRDKKANIPGTGDGGRPVASSGGLAWMVQKHNSF